MTPTAFLKFLRPTLHLTVYSTRQLAVLALLAEAKKPVDCSAIAKNLNISKPALSRNLDTLVKKNFVDRLYSERFRGLDTRRVFIGITEGGTDFLASMGVT